MYFQEITEAETALIFQAATFQEAVADLARYYTDNGFFVEQGREGCWVYEYATDTLRSEEELFEEYGRRIDFYVGLEPLDPEEVRDTDLAYAF